MAYAGFQMFMVKLKQLINRNHSIPLMNNPTIVSQNPQFQLFYEDLGSMIQTLFIDPHQDLQKVNDLKRRFIYAADEAEYIVDLFLSGVHIRNNGHSPTQEDLNRPLNLDDVRRSFESVRVEFMSMMMNNMKMDSSPKTERTLDQSAQTSITRRSKKLPDEIFVGLDHDVKLIKDKLSGNQTKLDVISIVGMGGIGKTTLATKVFNDGYVMYHFAVRVWVTVSQTYNKRDVLVKILESIHGHELELENASDSELRLMVHKHLMGKRYLVVIDDIWHVETWDRVKILFKDDNNGSRILLTSRHTEVAKHAMSDGFIHHLGLLDEESSLELLSKKVFRGDECPEWSNIPGMKIVKSCQGLPLALVVIAGILVNEAWSEELWAEIADRTSSYIVSDQNGCQEILALSYNHLPPHLRECFLYLGAFPEDHKFLVQRLISLWVAEGFIQQAGNESLEDVAESYLMDLIDRNLVTVSHRRRSNGAVKACTLHDLLREVCLNKAKEDGFILKILASDQFSNAITPLYKPARMFINFPRFPYPSPENLRSISFFCNYRPLSDVIAGCFRSFMLLRVLDLQKCSLEDFPEAMGLLVHLRYLAIWKKSAGFPASICNIWGLETLIYITRQKSTLLPSNISDLVNLRHLWNYLPSSVGIRSFKMPFYLPSIDKQMNLQTISNVELGVAVDFYSCFPNIKELRCTIHPDEENDFKPLECLERLKLTGFHGKPNCGKIHITLPAALNALTLFNCRLPWSDMSIIQSLQNLEVLKLRCDGFKGSCWNAEEQTFPQLKFLRLEMLDVKKWETSSDSFPCLTRLEVFDCKNLEEIPHEIGEIPTLELIKISNCSDSVIESVRTIEEEQHDWGNYEFKIELRR